MIKNSKTVYIVLVAVLLCAIEYVGFLISFIDGFKMNVLLSDSAENLSVIIPFLIIMLVPVWISGLQIKSRNWIASIIPILCIAPIPFLLKFSTSCTGFLCESALRIFSVFLLLAAAIYLLFYFIGIYFRKWDKKVVLSVILVELIVLAFCILYVLIFGSW